MLAEAASYLERIEDLRGQVRGLVEGLPAEALNWRPVEGVEDHAMNSLAVLAAHVAGAEQYWVHEVIGGRPKERVREEEFKTVAEGSEMLVEKLDWVGKISREVLGEIMEDDLEGTKQAGERTVPVRWAILHVIDHTSLHLGHMQITYQLWNSGKGVKAPRWFERLGG